MDYRTYLKTLLGIKHGSCTPTAMTRLLACGMIFVTNDQVVDKSIYAQTLEKATHTFGGTVATWIHHDLTHQKWHAMAVYLDVDQVVIKKCPLSWTLSGVSCRGKELVVPKGGATLFRVSSWITRTVFDIQDKNPFPLVHPRACEIMGLCAVLHLRTHEENEWTMQDTWQQMDMYITNMAIYTRDFDYTSATIVDILHAFGLVYVGSVNEVTSESEAWGLHRAIVIGRIEGYSHLWWIEDSTLFEDDQFNVVFRFAMGQKPYYIKRKLCLTRDKCRFQDKVTGSTSCAMTWDPRESVTGILAFHRWLASFLPSGARVLPYMRHEIVARYGVVTSKRFEHVVRPFFVNGVAATASNLELPHNSDIAPRLFYSPDLFIERRKIPKGFEPSTVHFDIHVKPWIETSNLQLYLRIEGDDKHAYRVLCHKENETLPEPGQLKAFVQSKQTDVLGKDAVQIVVLKRTLAPCGTIVMEFTVTTYWKPFRIYVDNQMCDYVLRCTLFPYSAKDPPTIFPPVEILVFTKKIQYVQDTYGLNMDMALKKTLQLIDKEGRRIIPLFFAKTYLDQPNTYRFQHAYGDYKSSPHDTNSASKTLEVIKPVST